MDRHLLELEPHHRDFPLNLVISVLRLDSLPRVPHHRSQALATTAPFLIRLVPRLLDSRLLEALRPSRTPIRCQTILLDNKSNLEGRMQWDPPGRQVLSCLKGVTTTAKIIQPIIHLVPPPATPLVDQPPAQAVLAQPQILRRLLLLKIQVLAQARLARPLQDKQIKTRALLVHQLLHNQFRTQAHSANRQILNQALVQIPLAVHWLQLSQEMRLVRPKVLGASEVLPLTVVDLLPSARLAIREDSVRDLLHSALHLEVAVSRTIKIKIRRLSPRVVARITSQIKVHSAFPIRPLDRQTTLALDHQIGIMLGLVETPLEAQVELDRTRHHSAKLGDSKMLRLANLRISEDRATETAHLAVGSHLVEASHLASSMLKDGADTATTANFPMKALQEAAVEELLEVGAEVEEVSEVGAAVVEEVSVAGAGDK